MTPYYTDDLVTLYHGDCLDVLAGLPDCSVDSVVTDPPYALEFMGKDWDRPWAVTPGASVGYEGRDDLRLPQHRDSRNANCRACGGRQRGAKRCECAKPKWDRSPAQDMQDFQAWCSLWTPELLRVLKPGGHLLAFGAPRTYHRMAVAIEDAGFEVRDSLMWLFGSGFPKSHDIGKAIDRAAGAEREVVGTRTDVATRIYDMGEGERLPPVIDITAPATPEAAEWDGWGTAMKPAHEPIILARKPLSGTVAANVLAWGVGGLNVDGCRVGMGDEYDPEKVQRQQSTNSVFGAGGLVGTEIPTYNAKGRWPANVILDDTAAALLDQQSGFSTSPPTDSVITIKANDSIGTFKTKDRTRGNGHGDSGGASRFFYTPKADRHERPRVDGVSHPTVKPVDLMAYLVRLVTPRGGIVLDPFAGTGTTAEAATAEGCRTILIEREADYLPLIVQRLQRPVEVTLW